MTEPEFVFVDRPEVGKPLRYLHGGEVRSSPPLVWVQPCPSDPALFSVQAAGGQVVRGRVQAAARQPTSGTVVGAQGAGPQGVRQVRDPRAKRVPTWMWITGVLIFLAVLGAVVPKDPSTSPTQRDAGSFPDSADTARGLVISNIRIVPFTSRSNGRQTQMALCDITNNNPFPVESVEVDMTVQFPGETKVYEEYVYCAEDHGGRLIQPGQTYSETGDEGEILVETFLYGHASRVTMTPTHAYQKGQWAAEYP